MGFEVLPDDIVRRVGLPGRKEPGPGGGNIQVDAAFSAVGGGHLLPGKELGRLLPAGVFGRHALGPQRDQVHAAGRFKLLLFRLQVHLG